MKFDYFKHAHGISRKEALHTPSREESKRKLAAYITSGKQTELGLGSDGEILLADSQRIHMHVIGEPGMGKSKILEYLIRQNIDNGQGFLLNDLSKNGETAYSILRYCALKGMKKVIFIDPFHAKEYKKVIGLNPFLYEPLMQQAGIKNIEDIIQVLFDVKDLSVTPNIQRYLKAILYLLAQAGATLYEAKYLLDGSYPQQQRVILNESNEYDQSRRVMEEVLGDPWLQNELRSTSRRLDRLFEEPIALMIAKTGVDFMRVIADGWAVIVNLNAFGFGQMDRKLLATLLMNQMMLAAERLRRPDYTPNGKNTWNGEFFLYLDEAGEYANYKLEQMMSQGRKTGLRVTVAHQHFSQFPDKLLLKGIRNASNIKVAFHIQDSADRMEIVKDMYGGDLSDREVAHSLSKLEKREAVIKIRSGGAAIFKVKEVLDPPVSKQQMYEYLMQIYSQPFYYSPEEIHNELNQRFRPAPRPAPPARIAAPAKPKPTTKPVVSNVHKPANKPKPPRKADSVFRGGTVPVNETPRSPDRGKVEHRTDSPSGVGGKPAQPEIKKPELAKEPVKEKEAPNSTGKGLVQNVKDFFMAFKKDRSAKPKA